MKYLKIFVDFIEKTKSYTDAEVGRLTRAMLSYANTGEDPDLRGNEKYIWDAMKVDIDHQRGAYDDLCRRNRINGSKNGGSQSVPVATEWERAGASGTQWGEDKEKKKEKKLIEDEEEDDEEEVSPRACDPVLRQYDKAATAIRAAYMASVGFPPTRGEINRLSMAAVSNGMVDLLAEAIDQAARNGARSIPGYALALLEEWSGQGIRTQKDLVRYQRIMQQAQDGDLSAMEAYEQLKGVN